MLGLWDVPLPPDGVKGPYAFSAPGHGVPSVMRYDRVAFVLAVVEHRFGKPLHSSATAPRFRGLTFSVQDGRVVAFTASSRRDMTTTAARVGDPLSKAAARYR